jgi:mono/diheme cytochrome c family protein
MTHRFTLPAVALVCLASAARAVEPSELKPGLVATFGGQTNPELLVTRLEPTVAITLKAGEAAHPRLVDTGSIRWNGYINVVRPGKYTFSATCRNGVLMVDVKGKQVVGISEGKVLQGGTVTLEGGVHPFFALFSITDPKAEVQVELRWQGPGFRMEPVPHQFLGHLPKDRPAQFAKDVQLEHGRLKFEELACVRCHTPAAGDRMAKGLADRAGPNLTDVAKRSYAGWLDAWLADPARLRPHTTMPRLFAADDTGAAERFAVVKYLVSLAGKPLDRGRAPTLSNEYRQSMDRGRVLFTVTGCAACHTDPQPGKPRDDEDEKEPLKPEDYIHSAGTAGPAAKYSLGAVGSKYRTDTLAAYLQNPLKVSPAGRMPHLALNGQEATDIARYLCRVTDETFESTVPAGKNLKPATIAAEVFAAHGSAPGEYAAFRKLPADVQWIDLGRKLLVTKGCVNCHAVEPGGKPLAAIAKFPTLADIKKAGIAGCLSDEAHAGKAPEYAIARPEILAVSAFLKDGLTGAGSPAPTHAARLALRRFNCLNCHSKDGEGGIAGELSDQMRLLEKAENADDVRPPLLTGIGHKSRPSWLKSVLTQGGRARPWMQLRMPQYGAANVGVLPDALAFLEGLTPDDTVHKVTLTAEKIAAGKQIVGKGGLGCVSCHDIAGVPNTGTRGPDLATIGQRVRFGWYERWLHQPLRMAPGTRMPQAFVDNKSTLATVLNGNPDAQAEAIWAYLSLGSGLPLPEGMEPPKGLVVAVKERPEVLRTFMPDAGSKAIAVGYPGGVSVAFSADQCRLAYAWAGNYLDASPVWNNRGGSPAKLLGPKFWTGPAGHPWGLTTNPDVPPDFPARANNPAFGTPLPLEPARVYDGPRAVAFDGFALDKAGRPTFRYHLSEGTSGVLSVAETPAPLKSGVAAGLARKFEIEAPAGYRAWLLAGQSGKEPRAVRADGTTVTLREGGTEQSVEVATGMKVVLPADGDRATVLELIDAPAGTQWRFVKSSGGWLAVVRLPGAKTPVKAAFALNVWGLPKDDDTLLKSLSAK